MPKSLGASAEETFTINLLEIEQEFSLLPNLTWSHWHMNCTHPVSNPTNGYLSGHSKRMAGVPLTSSMSA